MGIDALLAILHDLAMIALVGLLFVEFTLLRGSLDGSDVRRLGRVEALILVALVAVVVVGIGRLAWGIVPADAYLSNIYFWVKMGVLGFVILVALLPMRDSGRWRRALADSPGFRPPAAEVAQARRALSVELVLLPLVPIAAVMMARGFGTF
jgi:putative membrane protein